MDKHFISKRINSVLHDITKMMNTLYAMDTVDIQRCPDNYEVLSVSAALRAEWIACRLRHLIYLSTETPKKEYLLSAAHVQGIEVDMKDRIFTVTLPCLIPKKSWQSSEYLSDSLYYCLDQFFSVHSRPAYQSCVVCFSHIYNRDLPERRIRDYDNLEQKQIVDVIATFVLPDDSGLFCDTFQTTQLGDKDETMITVMEHQDFPKWFSENIKRR